MMRSFICLCLLTCPISLAADDAVSFRRDIAPILLVQCQACHGPKQAEGGYRVDTFAHVMDAGDSEVSPFTAEKVDESEVFRRITSTDEDERMPAESDPLDKSQIDLIRRWIAQGAKYDGDDHNATLASIIPAPQHPAPPEAYPFPVPITAIAFREGKNGRELLASGYHEITAWNPDDGALLRRITNQGQRTYGLSLSPDGKLLAAAGGTPGSLGEVRLFDPASGELLRVVASATDVVLDVAFSPDGKRLAAGTAENRLIVCDVATGQLLHEITSHSDWVNAVAWRDDGKQIAGASRDKTAKVFDATTGELAITYNDHDANVLGVAFHPDGKQVYSSDARGRIQRWKIVDGKKSGDVTSAGDDVFRLSVHGDRVLTGSANGSAYLVHRPSGKVIRKFDAHDKSLLSTTMSADGMTIATGAQDGTISLWNAETGERVLSFIAAPGYQARNAQGDRR